MNSTLIDDVIYLLLFVSGFCGLICIGDLIYTGLAKLFPNFERKLFALFGIDIDDLEDEDDEIEESGCTIIRFEDLRGESNER